MDISFAKLLYNSSVQNNLNNIPNVVCYNVFILSIFASLASSKWSWSRTVLHLTATQTTVEFRNKSLEWVIQWLTHEDGLFWHHFWMFLNELVEWMIQSKDRCLFSSRINQYFLITSVELLSDQWITQWIENKWMNHSKTVACRYLLP